MVRERHRLGFLVPAAGAEVCPAVHGELAIYLVQGVVDGAHGNDQLAGDCLARHPSGGHGGDLQLTGVRSWWRARGQGGSVRAFALRGERVRLDRDGGSCGSPASSLMRSGGLGGEQVEAEGGESAGTRSSARPSWEPSAGAWAMYNGASWPIDARRCLTQAVHGLIGEYRRAG
jgi:hypothetical protein